MLKNFTVIDIVNSVEATLLFALVLPVPGYVLGWITNVFRFRDRRLPTQIALSTPLAVSALPILIFLIGRYPILLWGLLIASWCAFGFLFGQIRRAWARESISTVSPKIWIACAFALAWAAVAIATLVDVQIGGRLYFSVPAYDYSLRAALTASAARSIPPANPFFANHPPVLLRYHYFWMLLCSVVMRLGKMDARQAMFGGTVWAGIVLMSLIAVCVKFFLRVREDLERKALMACGLLLVTGLDIIPTVLLYVRTHGVTPDMEWWNEQVTSWFDALLWTPHHIMALVACMMGFLLLREPVRSKTQRMVATFVAGVAFASASGLSVLVTFTFAVFIALWLPYATLRRWWDDVLGCTSAGAIALVLALPYVRTLLGPAADGTGGGGRFAMISVRGFPLGIEAVAWILHVSAKKILFLCLPLLPVNYFLELGFFFVVGFVRIRSIRAGSIPMTRDEESGWMMVFTSFLIGTFLRSTTIGSNDLGWRCFLLAQLVLLLWGAVVVTEWWKPLRTIRLGPMMRFAQVCLVLGAIATVYQVTMLRIYPILHDAGKVDPTLFPWLYDDQKVGERSYAIREVYSELDASLPAQTVLQYNPYTAGFIAHQIYSGHDAAVGAPLCDSVFGGDIDVCLERSKQIAPLFEDPSPSQNAAVDDVCRDYKIAVMLVDDTDAVWKHSDSWVWTRTPLIANQHVRAFGCGSFAQQAGLRSPS